MDIERLNRIAKEVAPESKPGFLRKDDEWAKFARYKDWVISASQKHSIRVIANVLIKEGVDFSPSYLRKNIKRLLDESAGVNTGIAAVDERAEEKVKPETAAPVTQESSDELCPNASGDVSSSHCGDNRPQTNRPQWVIDQEQKKLKEEQEKEEEIRQKPWKDPRLTMDERRRLQTEYVTKNAESVFKLKK